MKSKSFKLKRKTNDGLRAKIVVKMQQAEKETAIMIFKTCFSRTSNDHTKRKCKDLFYNEEFVVLKFGTFLFIAEEIYKFMMQEELK